MFKKLFNTQNTKSLAQEAKEEIKEQPKPRKIIKKTYTRKEYTPTHQVDVKKANVEITFSSGNKVIIEIQGKAQDATEGHGGPAYNYYVSVTSPYYSTLHYGLTQPDHFIITPETPITRDYLEQELIKGSKGVFYNINLVESWRLLTETITHNVVDFRGIEIVSYDVYEDDGSRV